MSTPLIDLRAFSGDRELEEGVLRSLVLDNHTPETLADRAEVYGALQGKAAMGVQVAVDPTSGKVLGSCFRFLGRDNAEIIKVSSPASKLWPACNKSYKLTISVGVSPIQTFCPTAVTCEPLTRWRMWSSPPWQTR